MSNGIRSLDGLYYPYADLRPSRALLEACLYLDRIYVLEPNFFRPPSRELAVDRIPRAVSMQPLLSAGFIEPIGPLLLGIAQSPGSKPVLDDENLALLKRSIDLDVTDPELLRMAANAGYSSWSIPTGQQLFWNGLGLLLERDGGRTEIHTDRPEYYRQYLGHLGYGHNAIISQSERRVQSGTSEVQIDVPFLEAESLMLTVALFASSELALYPFSDNAFHETFLRRKLMRMMTSSDLAEALRALGTANRDVELALQTIRFSVPRLVGLDADRVLWVRERCRDSLEEFRAHLRALSYRIGSQPLSIEFVEDCRRIVATEIEPALRKLEGDLEDKTRNLAIKVVSGIAKAAPLPLIATLAAGLSPEIALAAGAGVAAVNEVAAYIVERQSVRRNGLYFLLEARQ